MMVTAQELNVTDHDAVRDLWKHAAAHFVAASCGWIFQRREQRFSAQGPGMRFRQRLG
jgi:hypothetical protein